MRYEFDHRTGSMVPKKDDTIYFAQSQGGGLIVDDKKNNLRYIIERDGRLTKLFGSFGGNNLNLYDMRDARMIADRVVRLLGRNHKYSDFHYFLRGYHMNEGIIKNYSNYIGESVWSNISKRAEGNSIRREEGFVVGHLEDDENTTLIISSDCTKNGDIVEFDDGKKYIVIDENTVFVIVSDESVDTYYIYDENSDDVVNLVEGFSASTDIRYDEFGSLISVMREADWSGMELKDMTVEESRNWITFSVGRFEYRVYDNDNNATDDAVDDMKDYLEMESSFSKDEVENWRNLLGDGFIDEYSMQQELQSYFSDDFDDSSDEEKISKLLDEKIIFETKSYFEVDEDGYLDTDKPTFDPDDYKDEYVDKIMNDMDIIDEFINRFGYDGIKEYIDIDELAKKCVEYDGRGKFIAGYDGKERESYIEEMDKTYYIYRMN